jgi:hypothetical protein
MFVKILKVIREDNDASIIVEFFYTLRRLLDPIRDTRQPIDSANLIGIWDGKPPENHKWYDVEVAVEDPLIWEHNVYTVNTSEAKIIAENDEKIILQGQLEVTAEGFCTIQIGESLHALEIVGAPKNYLGFIRIHARRIRLFNTGIIAY